MATTKNTFKDYWWVILILGVLCVITYNNSYNKKLDEAKQTIDSARAIQQEMNQQWHRDFVMQQLSPQATPQQEANSRSMNEFYENYRCAGCNGTKTYRFVTPDGRLIVQQCPYCRPR